MLTDAKLAANQANAQLSTGPKTATGKSISSRNALRHGLTSTAELLPTENPDERKALLEGMLKDYRPLNATETEMVNQLADLQWRLRRASNYEAKILSSDNPDFKALNNMSLHAARLKRQFSSTLAELNKMQTKSRADRIAQLERAEIINYADRMLQRESTLAVHGFDFTLEQLEHYSGNKERFEYAKMIIDEAEDDFDEPTDQPADSPAKAA